MPKDLMFGKKYQDKNTGEEKTQWVKCGVVFEKEGRTSVLLETLPVGVSGPLWFSIMEQRPRGER